MQKTIEELSNELSIKWRAWQEAKLNAEVATAVAEETKVRVTAQAYKDGLIAGKNAQERDMQVSEILDKSEVFEKFSEAALLSKYNSIVAEADFLHIKTLVSLYKASLYASATNFENL